MKNWFQHTSQVIFSIIRSLSMGVWVDSIMEYFGVDGSVKVMMTFNLILKTF